MSGYVFMIFRTSILPILLACFIIIPGCTAPFFSGDSTGIPTGTTVPQKTPLTLSQPEASAAGIRMDTDVYFPGDTVEFVIVNDGKGDITCRSDPPGFSVRYQDSTGRWVTRMGRDPPPPGNETRLSPGESSAPSKFITTGWVPGRYRIVSDCGITREILLRSPLPVTPAATSCPVMTNLSAFIRINAISDQHAGEPFMISGTTSLKTGEELRYSIFAIMPGPANITSAKLVSSTLEVTAGNCGTNTWSVTGMIQVPGSYFIGISNSANTVSAVRRFTVLEKRDPAATSTIPKNSELPKITTWFHPGT